jgi:hypothetical protein
MLVRMFGIFGIILGAAYFNEGVSLTGVLIYALSQNAYDAFIIQLLFVTWDFLFGSALIVAGIGVLLLKDWARIMWLGLMPALVLVHLGIIVAAEMLRDGATSFYLVWTGMVVLVAAASWWYLTETRISSRFGKRNAVSDPPEE